jgi:hypothetical protein
VTLLTRGTDDWLQAIGVAFVGVILVMSLIAPAAAAAEPSADVTFVESQIATETTWTPADGPYRVIQDIEIAPGATLTVEPGTKIEFAEDITVTVSGSLQARGTATRPVEITRSDGAAADRRWASLEYNGTARSTLRLRNTTLRGGSAGITVASDAGTVEIVDSRLRDFTSAGLAIDETTAAPPITVRRTAFRDIGSHAIQASPNAGTTDRVSLTATPDTTDDAAEHTFAYQPGVGVSLDSIQLDYRSDGSVAAVGADSIERIGLDRNRNGSIERSFADSVASVSSTDSQLQIALSESVHVPDDGQLIVEYEDAVNPTTRGIYPVAVTLQKGGISQIAAGVEAPFVVGDVTSPAEGSPEAEQPTTRVKGLTVVDSAFSEVDGSGIFVAADRARRFQASRNRIDGVDGSGVVVRAEESESYFWYNTITAANDGIRIGTRTATSMTAHGNRIHNSRTGIRVRQSETDSYRTGDITLRENTLTKNAVHGIGISTRSLELAVDLSNNTVRENGRDGVHVFGWILRRGEISGNEVADNGHDGIAIDGTVVSKLSLYDNTIRDNSADGVAIRTDAAARALDVHNNTVKNSGEHGVTVQSDLLVHGSTVSENQLTNNAGAGLVVSSPITHRGNLSVANNVIAANTYGMVLRGVMETTVRDNDIVFNTNRFADPVEMPDVQPGTGSYVAEGAAGVIVNQAQSDVPLSELVSDPAITEDLRAVRLWEGTVAVLRTDGPSETRTAERSALTLRRVSGDIPTGIRVAKTGSANRSYQFTDNGLYGQDRGLTVDIAPFITANTTALIIPESSRTVHAESNYWGSRRGPYHSSILPEGDGNLVVTKRGWVDFVPFRETAPDAEYTRPTATIDTPMNPRPGDDIRLSASDSASEQGSIARYRFSVNGDAQSVTDRPTDSFEMPDEPVEVSLVVEDNLGIDSNTTSITIEPGTATTTATPASAAAETGTSPTPSTATTPGETPPPADSAPTLLGSLNSIWGILGGVFYLLALVFGGYGMALTVTNRSPPVDGLQIQALAGVGVLIWIVAGFIGAGPLLTVGIAAAVAWGALTGAAYLIATRGLV